MKNFKKLFLTSTLFALSGTSFLGAMGAMDDVITNFSRLIAISSGPSSSSNSSSQAAGSSSSSSSSSSTKKPSNHMADIEKAINHYEQIIKTTTSSKERLEAHLALGRAYIEYGISYDCHDKTSRNIRIQHFNKAIFHFTAIATVFGNEKQENLATWLLSQYYLGEYYSTYYDKDYDRPRDALKAFNHFCIFVENFIDAPENFRKEELEKLFYAKGFIANIYQKTIACYTEEEGRLPTGYIITKDYYTTKEEGAKRAFVIYDSIAENAEAKEKALDTWLAAHVQLSRMHKDGVGTPINKDNALDHLKQIIDTCKDLKDYQTAYKWAREMIAKLEQ